MQVARLDNAPRQRFAEAPHFLIGRDRRAGWVVTEIHGRCGGLFSDAESAWRYAREESGGHVEAIEFADRPIELALDLNRPAAVAQPNRSAHGF